MTRRDAGAVLACLAWTALFFLGVAYADLPPSNSDNTTYFWPAVAFLRGALLDGQFPLWNPYQVVGGPFLALHSPGASYPLLLAFLPFPAHVAVVLHSAVHVFLAALFTYGFARSVGIVRSGSIVAAVTFASSFPVVAAAVDNMAYLATISWLPGVLWSLRRVVVAPTARHGVLFSAAVAMCFLGGYSQGFLFIVQVGFVYALYLTFAEARSGDRLRALAMLGGGGGLALGLVSAQLLPTLEHAAAATRDLDGLRFSQAALYSLQLKPIVEALSGRGHGVLGLPALFVPLALVGLIGRHCRREAWFFLALFVIALDFMRGGFGTIFPLYFQLPYGNVFRIPLRIGFVTGFASAVLIGIGAGTLIDWLGRWPRVAALAAVVLVLGVAADQFVRNAPRVAFDALVRPTMVFEPPDLAVASEEWGRDRFFLAGTAGHRAFGQVHRRFMLGSYEPLLPGLYGEFFGIPPNMIWHGQLYVRPSRQARRDRPRSIAQSPKLLDLLSVRYYADLRPGGSRGFARIVGAPGSARGSIRVHERATAVPRVYVAHELTPASSFENALEIARSPALDPLRAPVVERSVEALGAERLGANEGAEFVGYEPNRVAVQARCETDCLLVLTDLYDPNWTVTVDGDEVELLRVNAIVRGVRLPAGAHDVVFRYFPNSIRIGLGLSVLSALLALALVLRSRRASA